MKFDHKSLIMTLKAHDLKSLGVRAVRVQVPLRVPLGNTE